MNALKQYSPNHFETIESIKPLFNKNEGVKTAELVKDIFMNFEKKSIDFAVMEHASNIMVIPSEFGWNDVGNFLAFEELFKSDENNNVIKNVKCISVDSNNNIIVSNGNYQRVSLLGVTNMIVAVTKDDILICEKNKNQDIKKIIKLL